MWAPGELAYRTSEADDICLRVAEARWESLCCSSTAAMCCGGHDYLLVRISRLVDMDVQRHTALRCSISFRPSILNTRQDSISSESAAEASRTCGRSGGSIILFTSCASRRLGQRKRSVDAVSLLQVTGLGGVAPWWPKEPARASIVLRSSAAIG